MRVTSLKLANLRAIETAECRFQPGFNLIVGVNGVGKTSMLDALRVCLSAFVNQANQLRAPVEAFALDDIRVGANALGVDCYVQIGSIEHHYLIHKPREASAPQEKKAGMPREQVHDTPGKASFLGPGPTPVSGWEPGGRPLAVLFSTNRAVPSRGRLARAWLRAVLRRRSRMRSRIVSFSSGNWRLGCGFRKLYGRSVPSRVGRLRDLRRRCPGSSRGTRIYGLTARSAHGC